MLLNSTVQLCGYLGNLMLEFSSARTIEQPHLDQHVPNQMALLDAGHLQRARQLGDLRFPAERQRNTKKHVESTEAHEPHDLKRTGEHGAD